MPSLPPVLFEDNDYIAFDKPSGLLVAPDRWDKARENLMGIVHDKLGKGVNNLHRIDAPTSGILLCAKNREALTTLSGLWEGRAVRKRYVALACGRPIAPDDAAAHPMLPPDAKPGSWVVDLPLAEDERQPGRMRVSHSYGKKSETVFHVREEFRLHSLIDCEPLTGRTHQIRVHLAALGTPIVADPFYGSEEGILLSALKKKYKRKEEEPEKPLIGRVALHAAGLSFTHPATGERVVIQSPLPRDFEVALKYLRKFAPALTEKYEEIKSEE